MSITFAILALVLFQIVHNVSYFYSFLVVSRVAGHNFK